MRHHEELVLVCNWKVQINMSTKTQIEKLLKHAFLPVFMEVRDVSEAHSGHADRQNNFYIIRLNFFDF